jgi:hypothetical protein
VFHFLTVAFWAPDFFMVVFFHGHHAAELMAARLALEFVVWHKDTPVNSI